MRRMLTYISLVVATLLLSCNGENGQYPTHGKVSIAYLQSIATERSIPITQDVYIEGRVVANDKLCEIEQGAVIADESGGIELKIENNNIDEIIPLFSHVRLRCSGLNIGREGARLVIGAKPTGEYVVDRLRSEELFNYISFLSDDITAPTTATIAIPEIDSRSVLRYVRFDDMELCAEEQGTKWCDVDAEDNSKYATTVRHFVRDRDTLRVVTSGECYYASELIPTTRLTLVGIIDWYDNDFALRITSHQVLR